MKKVLGIIGILLIFLFLIIYFIFNKRMDLYSKDLFYMDTYINVKFYCSDKDKASSIMNEIDNIYREYHELTDRYNSYYNRISSITRHKTISKYCKKSLTFTINYSSTRNSYSITTNTHTHRKTLFTTSITFTKHTISIKCYSRK